MKKLYFLYAVAFAAMASCSGNGQKADTTTVTPATDTETRQEVYTGVLPAADTEGIEYTLSLEYDSDENGEGGDYTMRQVYISETDPATFDSKGDFKVMTGTPQSQQQRYLRLISDSENGSPVDTTYFIVTSDTIVTMVGSDLTPSVTGLNYDLKLKK